MVGKIIFAAVTSMALLGCGQTELSEEPKKEPETKPIVELAEQTNCQDDEYRQLDFWVGEWDLEWDIADGKTGAGTNTITNTPYGDCVVTENFDGAPTMQFKGMSVSTYNKPAKLWQQTWVDDQGGYFALSGGPQEDGTFMLEMTRLSEKTPYRRMVWKDIKTGSLTWHWQGRSADEIEWKDLWVIRYTKKP